MAHHFHPRSTTKENLSLIVRNFPWKLLVLLPVLLILAIPTYIYAARAGNSVLPSVTDIFYNLSNISLKPTATPPPAFNKALPQVGSLLYTVGDGDNCDAILTYHMHMIDAGEIFSDVKPETIKALNETLGQDCHKLQPGMVLPLSPHYPLIAMGGELLKIDAMTPQQVIPTPLIPIQNKEDYAPDCSGGCALTVKVAPAVQVRVIVHTTMSLHPGSWVWFQATMARKSIPGFDTYPYADPKATINHMTLQACDFQVDSTHDDNSLSCDEITPTTIRDDGGAWLLGVVGSSGLDHWHFNVHAPAGTRLLLWLTNDGGDLKYHAGDPVYRYDDNAHLYVKL